MAMIMVIAVEYVETRKTMRKFMLGTLCNPRERNRHFVCFSATPDNLLFMKEACLTLMLRVLEATSTPSN